MDEGVVRLEPRIARMESDVANLRETVEKIDQKADRLDQKVEKSFARLDEKFERIDEKFERIDEKVNGLDKRMAIMECEFLNVQENQTRLHVDLRDLRGSLDSKFVWIVTTMIVFGAALLAAMAKGFHWLQ